MMPHIIVLLLIASSSFFTLGDETASWGTLSSGPSESECRPYIEKALQGASIHDSPSQTGDTDDVGGTGTKEATAQSEISESESSEIPSDSGEKEELKEIEGQPESGEHTEKASEEESVQPSATEDESHEEPPTDTEEEESIPEAEAQALSDETADELIKSEESVEAPVEGASNEEEVDVHSEVGEENEQSTEQAVEEENTLEVTEELSDEEGSPELKNDEEETHSSAEIVDEPGEETSDQPDPSSKEAEESKEESLEGPGQEKSQEDAGQDESHEASGQEQSQEAIDPEESQEQPLNKEETASGESKETEATNGNLEDSSSVQEGESSGEEAQLSSEVVDEPTSMETEEVTENHGMPDEIRNETEISSETADKSDEKSEEATDKSTEEGENKLEEPIETEKGDVNASEASAESAEVEQVEETAEASEESGAVDEKLTPHTETGPPESEENKNAEIKPEAEEASEETVVAVDEVSTSDDDSEAEKSTESEDSGEPSEVTEDEGAMEQPTPEEELSLAIEVPEKLRSREHMAQILRLSAENEEIEKLLSKTSENTLRDLKKLYDNAIKPLEILYKYRDLSNRHFGDPEIFSKPLILFMGPWSGGKSTIINYLLENEYKNTALRTGAEPSPAYFNIVMWGDHEEVLDGTQLAADWTFSGLQKFGQGLLDRLRGLRLNHPLLEKVNIVEIPGILEIRKQVERLFPFNDACQWFIDRADIIFLVYDPSKLDVGPETEAILDQLKGREMQTRIILNKADQVKPEELMRVQGTLIWNISPLMSSTEPPIMYSTSLWSIPYESGAPARLLYAQERAFLKDLKDAIDKRVENKIASARRFAVRVRNHAKMVDCYLTTYYNHKSFFGNKKKISDDIIEHPQNYHIYEGLSTLTNISRYDLPDPDVYRDFFRLNPVYEFQQLSSTCTYFRGCPINRLDVAIAYDLPELVGKYKKHVEEVLSAVKK